jgi:hypothetical protein
MAEIFAGLVCGYALALIATPVAAVALVRARVSSPAVARMMPEGTPLAALSIVLHMFAFLGFTAAGMLLGLLLNGIESNSPDGGLGSPNRVFTIVVIAIAAIAVLPMAALLPRVRRPLLASGALFAGVFGWLMPWLATLGD